MPQVELTDAEIAQLQAMGVLPPPAAAPEAPAPAPAAPVEVPAPPEAPALAVVPAPAKAVAVRDVVSQQTTQGWMHTPVTRYGIVVKLAETAAIVGVDDQGADVLQLHADVAWFGNDGLTTVAVDELTPIG